ncbi:hypothetical protein BAE44_0016070 [Dichanthelium oligosanthes]|uniref:DUF6598 domain-containing protein n=1 Tax=Dichanthelium oligosanthes TaxID=888268 RepID=A0A1E5VCP3_9POAL|nr:hypothetical protein BAE44_0016070 [Dichanthelium oligosanthes]
MDAEAIAAWRRTNLAAAQAKAKEAAAAWPMEDDDDDDFDCQARRFRDRWNAMWSGDFGDFEDTSKFSIVSYSIFVCHLGLILYAVILCVSESRSIGTLCSYCFLLSLIEIPSISFESQFILDKIGSELDQIPPMRYTDALHKGYPSHTLEIFSVKIAGITGGFRWPLYVFDLVAMRDSIDQNRNIIFQRSRVDCQTLTEKVRRNSCHSLFWLLLAVLCCCPSRGVVLLDPVTIEVDLKVKGPIESEDKTFCFLAEDMQSSNPVDSCLLHRTYTSKFSTLEFTLGHIIFSVEATISIRVIGGSWPDGFHGQFAACIASVGHGCGDEVPVMGGTASVNHKKVVLLSFGDGRVPVVGDGVIELSCRVVSASVGSKLKVSVEAWQDGGDVMEAMEDFTPKEAGRSYGELGVESCKMEVVVAWSLARSFCFVQNLVEN